MRTSMCDYSIPRIRDDPDKEQRKNVPRTGDMRGTNYALWFWRSNKLLRKSRISNNKLWKDKRPTSHDEFSPICIEFYLQNEPQMEPGKVLRKDTHAQQSDVCAMTEYVRNVCITYIRNVCTDYYSRNILQPEKGQFSFLCRYYVAAQ